tara:strand:+ start:217 stop:357 length:141 start_codon:yes stop_codon:yes gene_type:complete
MKKTSKDKKTNKILKKTKEDKQVILDKYGDKLEEKIDYGKDKPPHW